jgi:hypothetical protein
VEFIGEDCFYDCKNENNLIKDILDVGFKSSLHGYVRRIFERNNEDRASAGEDEASVSDDSAAGEDEVSVGEDSASSDRSEGKSYICKGCSVQ